MPQEPSRLDCFHLRLGHVGMQAYAEFMGEGVDEGWHGRLVLEVDGALQRAVRLKPVGPP